MLAQLESNVCSLGMKYLYYIYSTREKKEQKNRVVKGETR